ncbi:MAG: dihydroxy-acid dehydratase, partial [Chloroflexia bacterium]
DPISLNVHTRSLELEVNATELEERLAALTPRKPQYTRGYGSLFLKHVEQAHLGCDFDFLRHQEK